MLKPIPFPSLVAALNKVAKELKETNRLLESINKKLLEINIEALSTHFQESMSKEIIITALTLPDHLRRTLSALFKLGGEGTADDVSKLTGKARAMESAYLNQLETMGFVKREKRGREVIFCLP